MSTNTKNYDLKKPDQNDFYNVEDQNQNMDKIDAALTTLKADDEKHTTTEINNEDGVHGFRYHNDVLSYFNGTSWIEIETGSGGIEPSNVNNPKLTAGNGKVRISWEDPADIVVDGYTLCSWKGTKLVQKVGAYPENAKDGILILDNQVRDAYKENAFIIDGLTNGVTYYFQLFPYSDKKAVNENVANRLEGSPFPYKIMTVNIDLNNSNPETCITYADDAVGMTAKSDAWDEFFGHYPCYYKGGVEVGKINKNNFEQYEDGTSIPSGTYDEGNVVVMFPRRGLKISTSNNTLTVSMTDDPDDERFGYLAHEKGTTKKEKFYLGAYKGILYGEYSLFGSKINWSPKASLTRGGFRRGSGPMGIYQLTFIQAMYLLKYKNLDSQTALGRGYVDGNSGTIRTGGTVTKGMDFGETTGKLQMKLFGLEDLWGNLYEWIDGIVIDASGNILTATSVSSFNDTGAGYTNQGQAVIGLTTASYLKKPQGDTNTGFLVKEVGGSETTYFGDLTTSNYSSIPFHGGNWDTGSGCGIFSMRTHQPSTYSSVGIGARMMIL